MNLAVPTDPLTSAPQPGRSWLRALAAAPLRILALLLLPDRAVPATVSEGRYAGPLLVATLAALLSAFTLAARVDLTGSVLGGGGGGPGSGGGPPAAAAPGHPEAGMSDRELAEGLDKARAVEQVSRGARAAALPLEVVGLAVLLVGAGAFVGGRPKFRGALALASAAALPGAVRSLLEALAASRRALLLPSDVAGLAWPPLHLAGPLLGRLAAGVDPFLLWSVALLAVGMPRLTGLSRTRSTVTVVVCFVLWLLLTRVVLASPGGGGGMGGPGPGGHP